MTLQAVSELRGRALPLRRSNVDTDQIIPSEWLKRVERAGFGQGLFSEWRDNPEFVLNDARFTGAKILVAGENFGIGSSREHAVWALQDYGFEAVISSRFGDIFRINCSKVGVLPLVLSPQDLEELMDEVERNPSTDFAVNVVARTISVLGTDKVYAFEMADEMAHRFVQGLDDIGDTLLREDLIERYESLRPAFFPRIVLGEEQVVAQHGDS